MKRCRTDAIALVCLVSSMQAGAQQVADAAFDVSVTRPAFTGRHPVLVIDEAHLNFHTATGRYLAFANLMRNDGFDVRAGTRRFDSRSLRGIDVLVIANALGAGANAGSDDSPPAFTATECDAVRDWVRDGGSLLLVADHTPFGSAAGELASRFSVTFGKGFVFDAEHSFGPSPSLLVFDRRDSLLGAHAILEGRDSSERVNRVFAFTGQSMSLPAEASALLTFSATAREAVSRAALQGGESTPTRGPVQGLAMPFGRGRVVMLGEAAMLSAQLAGPQRRQMGMNLPGSDDKQFALNIARWLARALE